MRLPKRTIILIVAALVLTLLAVNSPVTHAARPLGITSVAFSPDGRQVLSGDGFGHVTLWDVATPDRPIWSSNDHTDQILSVGFLRADAIVWAASTDGTALYWDIQTGRAAPQYVSVHYDADVTSAVISPDGKRVLTGSKDGTVKLWEGATGNVIPLSKATQGPVQQNRQTGLAFSPDATKLLVGGATGTAIIWDLPTKRVSQTFNADAPILSVAFSPDGEIVLAGTAAGTALTWDTLSGKNLNIFAGHKDQVLSVAFSSDGELLLTGSADGTAVLWDARTGKSERRFLGHADWVTSVAFSPDGTEVVTGSRDGKARLWILSHRTDDPDAIFLER